MPGRLATEDFVETVVSGLIVPWDAADVPYTAGKLVFRNNRIYEATATTSAAPPSANWDEVTLPIAISDVTGLQTALNTKLSSPIAQSDVTGLAAALAAKLSSPIAQSDVTGLITALASKLTSPIAISDVTGLQAIIDAMIRTGTHTQRLAATPTSGTLYRESNTGLVYRGNGSSWDIWKAQGLLRKSATQTLNQSSIALQNVTDMTFPIEANEAWFAEFFLLVNAASINSDWLIDFTGPAGAGSAISWLSGGNSAFQAVSTGGGVIVPKIIGQTNAAGSMAGDHILALGAWFSAGATAGNIQLRMAQNTAQAEDNKILINSFAKLNRIA